MLGSGSLPWTRTSFKVGTVEPASQQQLLQLLIWCRNKLFMVYQFVFCHSDDRAGGRPALSFDYQYCELGYQVLILEQMKIVHNAPGCCYLRLMFSPWSPRWSPASDSREHPEDTLQLYWRYCWYNENCTQCAQCQMAAVPALCVAWPQHWLHGDCAAAPSLM